MQFSSLGTSKMEISETDFFDTLTIQNDQISYILCKACFSPSLYVFQSAGQRPCVGRTAQGTSQGQSCELFLGRAGLGRAGPSVAGNAPLAGGEGASAATSAAAIAALHGGRTAPARGPERPLPCTHPAGGPPVCGAAGAAFFRRQGDMVLQLLDLALHLQAMWLDRLRAPACVRPGGAKRFLMAYFPRPPEGGPALRPYARRPRQARAHGVARAEEQRPRRQGEGRVGARFEQHGSPLCHRCLQPGWQISRCRAGHAGHRAPGHGPPGRQVMAPEARQAGANALSAWLGQARPASAALQAPERPT